MIFEKLVDSAEKDEQPQYFIVTPKLLPNLRFSDRVVVHTVFSGCGSLPVWARCLLRQCLVLTKRTQNGHAGTGGVAEHPALSAGRAPTPACA
jgi:hypothetical protein